MTKEKTSFKGADCESLLRDWCQALSRRQILGTGDPALDGGICCPACGRIHGRCGDAMYPFLTMARIDKDPRWIKRAKFLFEWTENTVSQPNGAVINDIDSPWDGITVFYAIGLADCLAFHGSLLDQETRARWTDRLRKAADFLAGYEELNHNNINYLVSNGLALLVCGKVLKEPEYTRKAAELIEQALPCFTENGLLFGEGVPRFAKTRQGCRPVDIGYNVEESLPALLLYGEQSGDARIRDLAIRSFRAHLPFLLEDGGWDNSFGTRKFKWTYWGSRTSDGCGLGLLLAADARPEFAEAAQKNLELLRECTWEGLLMGGPHYQAAGQRPCVHHTFSHAKVLAGILDRGLETRLDQVQEKDAGPVSVPELQENREEGVQFKAYPEAGVHIVCRGDLRACVTAGDWEYLEGGHTSGGTVTLLSHRKGGVLLCAGVADYQLKEPNNMQIPRQVRHECLALRIEVCCCGVLYSSLYEDQAAVTVQDNRILVRGMLKDKRHQRAPGKEFLYRMEYRFEEDGVSVEAFFEEGKLICPAVSRSDERVSVGEDGIYIERNGKYAGTSIQIQCQGKAALPYKTDRIFHLTPGFQALRIDVEPVQKKAAVRLRFLRDS